MQKVWAQLWFWFWFGLCCQARRSEQARRGIGQTCGWIERGQCDTNLTCVPEAPLDSGETTDLSICRLVPLPSHCVPCAEVQCPMRKRACPGGHVIEPCGCCHLCAGQRGHVCGGPHWGRGYCDRHLVCARFLGHAPVEPPETGVCKALPGLQVDALADPLCPWVWGCNIRAGSCDCYGVRTCQLAFAYHGKRDCTKATEDDWSYESPEEDPPAEVQCTVYNCEVQGDQCVCMERSCFSQPPRLSEYECEKQLKQARCTNVTCPVVPVPSCPPDSFLTVPYTPPYQCCPLLPALCTCAFEKCPAKPKNCPPGHRAYIVTRGNGLPGNCCHRYSCGPGEEESAAQKRDEDDE